MNLPIKDLKILLKSMQPVLNQGCYLFVSAEQIPNFEIKQAIASIREAEDLSLVISKETALEYHLPTDELFSWISLSVHSDLQAVGLTAAFSSALAQAGISCNVIAGLRHDHIFVPLDDTARAMQTLRQLQNIE